MFRYSFNGLIGNVIVVGCGGTGSRAIPLVAQLLCSNEFTKNIKITLIDGDIVELKNTKRQMFLAQEVGKNKAEVLADRYRRGFGANIDAVPHFIPSCEELEKLTLTNNNANVQKETVRFMQDFLNSYLSYGKKGIEYGTFDRNCYSNDLGKHFMKGTTTVVISCVDSPDARRRLLQLIPTMLAMKTGSYNENLIPAHLQNFLVIDAGNEDAFGQVSYFNPIVPTLCDNETLLKAIPDRSPCSLDIGYVPMPIGKYKNMKEGIREGSCADLDQTLAINQMMATFIGMIFQNLLYGMKMDFHTIRANLNGTFSSDKMSLSWMKGVLSDNPEYLFGAAEGEDYGNDVESFRSLIYGHGPSKYTELLQTKALAYDGDITALTYTPIAMETPQFLQVLNLKAPLSFFYKTHFSFGSWKDLIWPTLFENISSGFLQLTEGLKKEILKEGTYDTGSEIIQIKAVGGQDFSYEADDLGSYMLYNACTDICKTANFMDTATSFSRMGYKGLALASSKGKLVAGKGITYVHRGHFGRIERDCLSLTFHPHRVVTRNLVEMIIETEGTEAALDLLGVSKAYIFRCSPNWIQKYYSPYRGSSSGDMLRGIDTEVKAKGFQLMDVSYQVGTAKVFHSNGRMVQKAEDTEAIEKKNLEFLNMLKEKPEKAKKAV